MKFNDDITQSIAATVKDVLEGKATKKEEVKYPHDMFHPETGKKEVAKDEAEHKALSAKGYTHEKPKVNEVEEPNKPSGKLGQDSGERDFKAKHAIKKSGEKEDGSVVKEETLVEALNQRQLLKVAKDLEKAIKKSGNLVSKLPEDLEMVDGDFTESYGEIGKGQEMMDYGIRYLESDIKDYFKSIGEVKEATDLDEDVDQTFGFPSKDKLVKFQSQVKGVKPLGNPNIMKRGGKEYHVMMFKGSVKNIEKAMKLAMSIYDESVSFNEEVDEESEKQKKYQAFFQKALKKFGVKSPSELEGDKKKEFFDYVDANYEADKEADESVKEENIEEATLKVTAYTGNMNPAKIKLKKGKANSYGGHDVTAVGSEKDLIAWAVRSLGVVKPKNFRDAQKQIDDMS
jgi:hypothetical protein